MLPNRWPRWSRPLSLIVTLSTLALGACRADPVTFPRPPASGGTGGAEAVGPIDVEGTGGAPAPKPDGAVSPAEVPPAGGPPRALGEACDATVVCASGYCSDGVCCNKACDRACSSCVLPGLEGTCVNVTAGEDPRKDCPAEPPSSCGRSGGCDGMGRCLAYELGTECMPLACRDGIESAAGHCTGAGRCQMGESRLCGSNQCSNGRCKQGCSVSAPCPTGFECVNAECVGIGAALYWRFDEPAGATTAMDSSAHAFGGLYLGEGKNPEPSTSVPPTTFNNPRSRSFAATGRPAVQLPGVSGSLKPPNDITLALWYRATTALAGGSDAVSLGGDYFVRIKPVEVEWVKRVSNVAGMVYGVTRAPLPNHLDGKWHHIAGVTSVTGMRLFHDGVLKVSNARGEAIVYNGNDLWVGRDGSGAAGRDFTGEIDDVRIYTRALSAQEIAALAAGGP